MTILVCQKRHHEPHFVWDVDSPFGGWTPCLGRAVWPYARPKPPRGINGGTHTSYLVRNPGIAVYKDCDDWAVWVERGRQTTLEITKFPTHAEAIEYAQALVNERRKTSGTDQGA